MFHDSLVFQGTLPISDSQAGTSTKSKDRRIFLFEQSVIIADHIPPKKEFGNPIYIFKNQIMVRTRNFRFPLRSLMPKTPSVVSGQQNAVRTFCAGRPFKVHYTQLRSCPANCIHCHRSNTGRKGLLVLTSKRGRLRRECCLSERMGSVYQ